MPIDRIKHPAYSLDGKNLNLLINRVNELYARGVPPGEAEDWFLAVIQAAGPGGEADKSWSGVRARLRPGGPGLRRGRPGSGHRVKITARPFDSSRMAGTRSG